MDPLARETVEVAPTDPRVMPLIARHLSLMRASSPACSVHAMEAADLCASGARFFAIFNGEAAVAMGAIKSIDAAHAELKSMHVKDDCRGRGLADAILSKLIETAQLTGHTRVSLETGSQEPFAAARAFYGKHGFSTCPPFEGYTEDINSVFMTKVI